MKHGKLTLIYKTIYTVFQPKLTNTQLRVINAFALDYSTA